MKKNSIINSMIFFTVVLFTDCAELDYSDKEYYKQEAYIINSESSSSTEREIINVELHTFVDTLKIINDSYDMDTIWDNDTYECPVIFKVGIGGSQPALEDMEILVAFDEEQVSDFNTLNNTKCRIPDELIYSTNIPYDTHKGGYPVIIKKGTSSSSLIFTFKVIRDTKKDPCKEFLNYSIPLKIISASGGISISRQYDKFMVAKFTTNVEKTVNWSGYPIPKIPPGRYYSVRLKGNAAENTDRATGIHYVWKYILPLEDPDTPEDQKDPSLYGKYMIFGTGIWSWTMFAYHGNGWMYNLLELEDEAAGTYIMRPILRGDRNFPFHTFNYASTQKISNDNRYDPKLKQLTVHYIDAINSEYYDILTYVGEPVLDVAQSLSRQRPLSWSQLKAKGYKYWIPEEKE